MSVLSKYPPKFEVGEQVVVTTVRKPRMAKVLAVESGWPYANYQIRVENEKEIVTVSERDLGKHIIRKENERAKSSPRAALAGADASGRWPAPGDRPPGGIRLTARGRAD